MVTYEKLSRRPQSAPSLIGMTLEAVDKLYAEFAVAHAGRLANLTVTKRNGTPRQRAVGAEGKHRYSLRDRLLMTLFWLRVYTTDEVMGFFYELNKTNIEDTMKDILATLETMTSFTDDRPGPARKQLRSAGEVMDAFPDVRLVVDSKEQRIARPKVRNDEQGKPQDRQKPYYSGKKKAHTLKNHIAVRPDGLIEAVSERVPGGQTHDLTLLRQTGLIGQLEEGEAAMLAKAYDGLQKDYPGTRLYLPCKARRNHPLTEAQKAYNRFLARYRIVGAHTLACMNRCHVLRQVYRHQRSEHSQVVRIVAGLVNRRIAERPLKVYAVAGV